MVIVYCFGLAFHRCLLVSHSLRELKLLCKLDMRLCSLLFMD